MLLATGLSGFAADFSVTYGDSVRIGFNLISTEDLTVSITGIKATGSTLQNLVIPETVTRNGRKYTITRLGEFSEFSGVDAVTLTKPWDILSLPCKKVYVSDLKIWLDTKASGSIDLYVNGELLTDLVIPEGVTELGGAFAGNKNIRSVTIPAHVKTITAGAFSNCKGLTTVVMAENSVETIGKSAFKGCSNLTSVTLSEKLTEIPYGCFWDCTSLQEVNMVPSITAIGESAFRQCESLKEIKLPTSLESIGKYAFYYCKSLESMEIPDFVTSIGRAAFDGCSSIKSLTIGNSVREIDEATFSHLTSLRSLNIGNAVTLIGSGAFYNCSALETLVIPNSVVMVSNAFSYCPNLKSLTIGKGIKNLSDGAFSGSKKLTSITCVGEKPAELADGAFASIVYVDATVNVPEGAIDAYRASNWSKFLSINDDSPVSTDYSVSVTAGKGGTVAIGKESVNNGKMTVTCAEDDDVVLTITPDKGYKISAVKVNGTDVTKDMEDGQYTLEALDGDTSITVAFEAMVYERDDVNEDGEVNTADVTHIYNRIIYGKGNQQPEEE